MSRRTAAALAVVAVLASAQAGCGSTNTLTATQLRSRASKICYAAQAKVSAIPTPTLPSDEATFLSRGIAVLEPELAQLKRLVPPAGSATHYALARTAMQTQIEVMKAALARLDKGSDPLVEIHIVERQLAPIESRANAAWDALAITVCGDR